MKRFIISCLVTASLSCFFSTSFAKQVPFVSGRAVLPGEQTDDRPPNLPVPYANRGGPDTLGFGYIDGDGFAVLGEVWTFDHGDVDPFEGWETTDLTQQNRSFFRQITAGIWTNGDAGNGNVPTGNAVAAPILSGLGSAWVGAFQNEADDLCWDGGLGYGNSWCQRLLGPVLDYDGSATIEAQLVLFSDTEEDFDYSNIIVQTFPSETETEIMQFTGEHGVAVDHPISSPPGEAFNFSFDDFGTDTRFRVIFSVTSDGGWSDEDAEFTTEYGPLAVDEIVLENTGSTGTVDVTYDFESDLDGWTPEACLGFGSFEGIAPISNYLLEDACQCELAGNVLEHHNDSFEHPYGQNIEARSGIVDVENDVDGVLGAGGELEIFADWSQYAIMPRANGVFYRPGWDYYPFVCPATGAIGWSGRVGDRATFFSTGDDATCFESRNIGSDGDGVPQGVEQLRFIFEMIASCDGFAIPPEECTNETNFTPLIDNVQIRFTNVPLAPRLSFDPGAKYTDGFGQAWSLDPNEAGNANAVYNVNFSNVRPYVHGDSITVVGPVPSPGFEYDTRLWFRIGRKGPGTNTGPYDAWRARVQLDGALDGALDGVTDIETGDFATAKMDSLQIGVNPSSSKFESYFIEGDARFDAGAGERSTENEIIADGVLLPGTRVDYFLSANYVSSTDELYTVPDTTGGFYSEFEILPRWRDDNGTLKFPCVLYIDAFNGGAEFYIENALNSLGIDFDRLDHRSDKPGPPLYRDLAPGSNNGATLAQLLGYRCILFNIGSKSGYMYPEDALMLSDWLTALHCEGGFNVQGLIMNGDNMGQILDMVAPTFLQGQLGATFVDRRYHEYGGNPDEGYCVGLEAPSIGTFAYGTENSQNDYEYDAWGNWCPSKHSFDILGTIGSGVGNRAYVNADTGEETFYAQVVNSVEDDNNRSVIDGVSWHHLSDRDAVGECSSDSAHIVTAVADEIRSALEWVFGVGSIPALCENPCGLSDVPEEVGGGATTRMFQNAPNPFHPYTTLRFSLASTGPVELTIYDVAGRKVKTLLDGVLEAGSHEVVWDGTDQTGHDVSAGVYWSQFDALGLMSNKKMVLLPR